MPKSQTPPTVALSIRQPWAWLIVNGFKDIENRDWPTQFKGRIRVHAGKGMTRDEYEFARDMALDIDHTIPVPAFEELERGGFVGEVTITGCVTDSRSHWFVGEYGFTLEGGTPTAFVPYSGKLGFFNVKEAA